MITKLLMWSAGTIVIGGLGLVGWGMSLPGTSTTERDAEIEAPISRLFAVVTDVQGQARWRSDVGRIEMAPDGASWTEHLKQGGELHFRTVRMEPDRVFEIEYSSSLGFQGRWSGTFTASGGRTRVHFVEVTTIRNPISRVVARVISPPGNHLSLYLRDLRAAVASGVPENTT